MQENRWARLRDSLQWCMLDSRNLAHVFSCISVQYTSDIVTKWLMETFLISVPQQWKYAVKVGEDQLIGQFLIVRNAQQPKTFRLIILGHNGVCLRSECVPRLIAFPPFSAAVLSRSARGQCLISCYCRKWCIQKMSIGSLDREFFTFGRISL